MIKVQMDSKRIFTLFNALLRPFLLKIMNDADVIVRYDQSRSGLNKLMFKARKKVVT